MDSINIRKATILDSHAISNLISRNAKLLLNDDFENDGLTFFLNTVSHSAIRDYMEQGFTYLVAQTTKGIIGVIAIKDYRHMFHLFVDPEHHHQGIAKKLWHEMLQESLKHGNEGYFTLNSTSYALAIYERWGFKTTDSQLSRHGIRYTPMELHLKQ